MKRVLALLAAAVQFGCGTSTAPSELASSYFLSTLDGKPLPVAYGADGSMLVASLLDFGTLGRPRKTIPATGTVRYVVDVQRPDQFIDHSEIELNYSSQGGILRIDLCPPRAQCLIAAELAGPIDDQRVELLLTYYLGGKPGSVYRFVAALPD